MITPSPFPNARCWNDASRPQVMDTVALHVRDSVFMATHFPCPIQRVSPESRTGEPYSEEQYLRDFLDSRRSHVFSVVYGDSGTGKSHLVRWLARNLNRGLSEGLDSVHAVLVPRESANLAAVLMRILEGCSGPVVSELQRKISESREHLTVRGAMTQVLDALAFVLEPENLTGSTLEFPSDEEHEFIVELLPHLLRAQPIRRALLADQENGVVSRIARHVSRERRELRPDEEDAPSWRAVDMEVLTSQPPSGTGEDWKELCNSLVSDERLRETTASVLNLALTEALPRLMGVRRGDLAEALREVRQFLASEGKSLILLIEDLSVAQGVDEELIECLLPGEYSTGLCPLRSVIGITNDDFERLQSNIAGRIDIAVTFSARIARGRTDGGYFAEADLLDFASRYLNATRYSVEELDNWHEGAGQNDLPPSYCVESRCPNLEICHRTFGEVEGRGLYPLNPDAILRLYRACEERDRMSTDRSVFKPRRLISRVLSPFLSAAEREVPVDRFPSPSLRDEFGVRTLGASRQQELKDAYAPEIAGRIAAAWEIYSDDPYAGTVDSDLLAAFELPVAAGTRRADVVSQRSRADDGPAHSQPPAPAEPAGPDEFDQWVNGGAVANNDLNPWRSGLYKALSDYWDWDSDPFYTFLFKDWFGQRHIEFEGQRTGTGRDTVLHVPRSPENGIAMRALMRGCAHDNWQEAIRTLEFLQRCTDELRRTFSGELRKGGREKGKRLAIHSLAQACLLTNKAPSNGSAEGFWAALFDDSPPATEEDLDQVQQKILTEFQRGSLLLKRLTSCRKGMQAGSLLEAADYVDLVRSAARAASPATGEIENISNALYGGFSKLADVLEGRVPDWGRTQLEHATQLVDLVELEAQGAALTAFIDDLRASLDMGHRRLGLSTSSTSLLEDLATLEIGETEVQLARKALSANTSANEQLAALSQLPAERIERLLSLCKKTASEFDRLEERTKASTGEVEDDPVELEGRIREELGALIEALEELSSCSGDLK